MSLSRKIFKLKGIVQHYSWGGYDFIPQLLEIENKDQKPYAEYWLGAHPNHPAMTEDGISLAELVSKNVSVLGETVAVKFTSLPYLFKILDVRQMLSIQVHPSKKSAEKGFEEEEKKGIPVNAPHRNYKDKNHKPELMVALGDFWLLHGFKKEEALIKTLESNPELAFLKKSFGNGNYQRLYEEIMLMEQEGVNEILKPLLQRIIPLYESNRLEKVDEHFWAARAALNFCKNDNYDRGIFSVYLFNLVHLKKGEGIFQSWGLPHAYLEGQNVEIMANSDNVLRAGLTDKHIDVSELMKHVKFEATDPNIFNPPSGHSVYSSPAEEFELQRYALAENDNIGLNTKTGEIFFVLNGEVKINEMDAKKGEAIFVTAGTELSLNILQGAEIYRVTVPGT